MTTRRTLVAILLVITSSIFLVQAQQDEGRVAISRGNELVAQAQYEAAIREYQHVSPIADRYPQALYNIGVCHYELGQTESAIDFYVRALTASNYKYPRASYALGVALEDVGRFDKAREAYRQSIVYSRGDFAPAQFRFGLLLVREGDYGAAGRHFREAIKRPGEHLPASHNNLGVVLAWTGRLKEAEGEFKIALQLRRGMFEDAAENLKLCQHLLARETTKMASLKVSDPKRKASISRSENVLP